MFISTFILTEFEWERIGKREQVGKECKLWNTYCTREGTATLISFLFWEELLEQFSAELWGGSLQLSHTEISSCLQVSESEK